MRGRVTKDEGARRSPSLGVKVTRAELSVPRVGPNLQSPYTDLHLFGIYKAGWPVGCCNVSDYPSIRPNVENYSRHFRHDYMTKRSGRRKECGK